MTTNPPRDDAPELRVTLMPSEAQLIEAGKALAYALEYLRGESPGVTSGGHRNSALRNQIKWVLLGCDGPLRADTPARAGMVKPLVEAAKALAPWVSASMDDKAGEAYIKDANAFLVAVEPFFALASRAAPPEAQVTVADCITALRAMPTREEWLGGQSFKYIQLGEAIETLRALSEDRG